MPEPRTCKRCGTTYPARLVETAFRTGRWQDASNHRQTNKTRRICRACEQTARDERKQRNRWRVKARDTIRRHAERLDGVTKQDLISIYGWDPNRLAHDAEFQYNNGCNYCGKNYADMGHGLADITLDIQDPRAKPYYRTNTKWCCQTCNRLKWQKGPEAFELDRQMYELRTSVLSTSPEERGMLF